MGAADGKAMGGEVWGVGEGKRVDARSEARRGADVRYVDFRQVLRK